MFPDREYLGWVSPNQVNTSARGIPQIVVVMGSCIVGGAYMSAMPDKIVVIREQVTILFAGPPLAKAATDEMVSAEEIDGVDVHRRVSGVVSYYTKDDDHALAIARHCAANLNWRKQGQLRYRVPCALLYPAEEPYGVVPVDSKQSYDAHEVIARLVNGSESGEFKALSGVTPVYGSAHPHDCPIAIPVNSGILFVEVAQRGAHFIELVCQCGTPLLLL